MTAHQFSIFKSVGLWIWQGSHGVAWVVLNIAALLEDIDQLVKIFGGLVIIGSGITTWYFAVKNNRPKRRRKK